MSPIPPSDPLKDLLDALGLPESAAASVEIRGQEPILPCRYPLAQMAASAIVAGGIAASDLWVIQGGQPQSIRVDLDAAAAGLMGFAVLRGGPPLPRALPLSELYRCGDGRWIHFHGGYPDSPHLSRGILERLDCADERNAIASATAKWESHALEDTLADAGLCAAVARTAEEWAAHPQGAALRRFGPVEVRKIAEGDPEPLPGLGRPLAGIRVLDLTRVLAGPTCARTLAEHGADVLHLASPRLPNFPAFVADTSHGKLSAHLDLDRAADIERLRELVSEADVFCEGYRPGSLGRRGFGAAELTRLRPGLIYVTVSCYGHEGPWRGRRGWEQLAQTVSGIALGHGGADHPQLVPAAACDYTTGYLAAVGVLVALARRAREGGSYHVHASLCQTAMWIERFGADALAPEKPASVELGGPPALAFDRIAPWLTESETPYGRLTHLAPVLQMSETPPRWSRPSSPLGSDPARWPARGSR